jgi:glycosyltransferase involved in cell wall biosynthesis
MGEHRRRKIARPYWANNVKLPVCKVNLTAPPQVMAARDIKITDKTICFVGPKSDCCIDKIVKEYVPFFEKEGYQIVFTLQKGMQEIIQFVPKWVVLVRVGTNSEFGQEIGLNNVTRIVKHLQQLGVRIVYYIDDFLVNANQNAPIQIANMCDAVIVATSELKDFFKKLSNFAVPVIHVPTHINLPIFDYLPKLDWISQISKYKVLMTSSGRVGATLLFEMCEKANARWEEFKDIEWIINANGVAQMRTLINGFRNLYKTYIDWLSIEDYYRLCKSVNLIINPVSNKDIDYLVPPMWQSTWLDSKSAVKYTMAGAAKIPIISSPSRSYTEAIQDGKTGFIVRSADEFLDKILYCKANPIESTKIGLQAREDIEENYDIKIRYPLYRDAIMGNYKEIDNSIGILTAISDGGPGTFGNTLKKYIPRLTNNKYKIVDQDSPAVKYILSIAFLNAEILQAAKKRDPSIKFIERMDGLPFVSYLGDNSGQKPGEIQECALKVMKDNYELADLIVWQSEFAKKVWEPYVDTTKKSVVIYNGVDTEIFNTSGPHISLPGNKTKILINSWSIFPHKRADLIEGIAKQYPNIDFHLVGNYFSLDTAKTMELFSQLPNIMYYGPVKAPKQLVNLYRSTDAMLFLSEHEGCSNTALEAAACQCPIIYNKKCNVVPEMFGEDLVFGFDTIDDLRYIFEVQLEDKEFIQSIRKGLLKKIQDTYTAEIMIKKYLEVLI